MKLSSFELATEVSSDVKAQIERSYNRDSKVFSLTDSDTADVIENEPKSPEHKNVEGTLKDRYHVASKSKTIPPKSYSARAFRDIDVKFLPYCVDYRQQLAVYNYQPPELLINDERFVFPTGGSDVYSLTLILWELLNKCVPFAIYDSDELKDLYATDRAHLPIIEDERCRNFKQIFKYGFERYSVKHNLDELIKLLTDAAGKLDVNSNSSDITGQTSESQNYVYDDFGLFVDLEGNKNLISASTDTLDNINFDLISPSIIEPTAESVTRTTNQAEQQCILKVGETEHKNHSE